MCLSYALFAGVLMNNGIRLCAAVIGAMITVPSWACSICRCGDPTFNALGKEGVAQSGLRLAFDWEQFEKAEGIAGDDFDFLRERRSTLLVAYGISDRFGVFARIPYSSRELTETANGETEEVHHSGLADPELYGQVRLWSSALEGDVGVRTSLYAVAGVKTHWGENDASVDGARLDEHAQTGTGSTDWFAGLSGSYQINPRSALFASAQYRHTGYNDYDYRYGSVRLINLAYEHKLGSRWDAVLEVNYRNSNRDVVDALGNTDPNTGGAITYLTPRLLFDVGGGWVIRAAAQLPLSNAGLNGFQDERSVANIGVTRVFLH
jgi:opacity protein-like surface antigen